MINEPTDYFERQLWLMGCNPEQIAALVEYRDHQSYYGDEGLLLIARIAMSTSAPKPLGDITLSVEDAVGLSSRARAQQRSAADVKAKRRPGKYGKWGGR